MQIEMICIFCNEICVLLFIIGIESVDFCCRK